MISSAQDPVGMLSYRVLRPVLVPGVWGLPWVCKEGQDVTIGMTLIVTNRLFSKNFPGEVWARTRLGFGV